MKFKKFNTGKHKQLLKSHLDNLENKLKELMTKVENKIKKKDLPSLGLDELGLPKMGN